MLSGGARSRGCFVRNKRELTTSLMPISEGRTQQFLDCFSDMYEYAKQGALALAVDIGQYYTGHGMQCPPDPDEKER